MKKFCVALMVHQDFDSISKSINYFVREKIPVVIHVDKKSSELFDRLIETHGQNDSDCIIFSEVNCEWGRWSLAKTEMMLYQRALERFPDVSHVHLMSAADILLKSSNEFEEYLMDHIHTDFVELVDIQKEKFVIDGLEAERFKYYYFFKFNSFLFNISFKLQRKIGISRQFPRGFRPLMGRQFKTLSKTTIQSLETLIVKRPDIVNFFKTVFIPDESFIPTLVGYLYENKLVNNQPQEPLTYCEFNSNGRPYTIYKDNIDALSKSRVYTARKKSSCLDSVYFDSYGSLDPESVLKEYIDLYGRPILNVFLVENEFSEIRFASKPNDFIRSRYKYLGGLLSSDCNHMVDWESLSVSENQVDLWRNFIPNGTSEFIRNIRLIEGENIAFSIHKYELSEFERKFPFYKYRLVLHLSSKNFCFNKLKIIQKLSNRSEISLY